MKFKFFVSTLSILFVFSSCQDDSILSVDDPITTPNELITQKKRTCLSTDHSHGLMQNPEYVKAYKKRMALFEKNKHLKMNCSNPYIIPVAVHYQSLSSGYNEDCLRTLAQSQIDALNADFSATNGDISKWTNEASGSFPQVQNGAACLRFVFANTNHPSGSGLQEGEIAVTFNKTIGDQNNQWSGYLNIYVMPQTGALGYAPLGGAGNGDGVVIDATAFGTSSPCSSVGADAPFNLGRTTTHEVGHYFLLDHIWGDGCGTDDDVSDTPNSAQEYYDCPAVGESSCGSADLHMNYMDYTNDECMYMFSNGQATRMTNYVSASLSILTSNAQNVINGAPEPNNDNNGPEETDDSENTDDYNGQDQEPEPEDTNDSSDDPEPEDDNNGSSNCEEITISITLDEYGSETTWTLYDEDGYEVISDGPFDDNEAGMIHEKSVCIPDGCYSLLIEDSYGDGICCDYGEGQVTISDQGGYKISYSDGYFGDYEVLYVCNDSGDLFRKNGKKSKKKKSLKKKK